MQADEPKLKRSREGTPTKGIAFFMSQRVGFGVNVIFYRIFHSDFFFADGKQLVPSSSFRSVSPSSGDNGVKPVQGAGAIVSPGVSANSNPFMSQSLAMVPPETWLQVPMWLILILHLSDFRSYFVPFPSQVSVFLLQNERELKRERRKQSNRESARRSRLRKQVWFNKREIEALSDILFSWCDSHQNI